MRQRKVKNLEEKLDLVSGYAVTDPQALAGKWREYFGSDAPLRCELGSGKGKFLTETALAHPDVNFIGAEGQKSVVLKALEKAAESGVRNVRFITAFVNDASAVFAPGELSGIYINFCDPWPKARHEKRRLTHRARMEKYRDALREGGSVELRTDDLALFEWSLEEAEAAGFIVDVVSRDYISDIPTEYEEKFRAAGKPVNFARFIRP